MADALHVIIDLAESHEWDVRFAEVASRLYGPRQIPPGKRPTILQDNREVAVAEALRLQQTHPEGRFVVFTATAVTHWLDVATHVNLAGQPMRTARVARLSPLDEAPESP